MYMEIGAYFNVIYRDSIVVERKWSLLKWHVNSIICNVKDPTQKGISLIIPLEPDQDARKKKKLEDNFNLVYLFVILYGGCTVALTLYHSVISDWRIIEHSIESSLISTISDYGSCQYHSVMW